MDFFKHKIYFQMQNITDQFKLIKNKVKLNIYFNMMQVQVFFSFKRRKIKQIGKRMNRVLI